MLSVESIIVSGKGCQKALLSVESIIVSGKGCQKALLYVKFIINYNTCRGSSVYMAALDASKAFGS